MSGALGGGLQTGGINADIPLQAGRGVVQNTLASDPNKMLQMLQGINSLKLFPGQLQLQQQGIQTGEQGIQSRAISLAEQGRAAANSYLVSLLQNPNPQLTDVVRAHAMGVNDRIPMDAAIADAANTFPVAGTPEERRAWVAARASQSGLSPAERLAANVPHAGTTLDTGPTLIPTTVGAPLGSTPGQTTPTGVAIPKDFSPGEAATRIPTVDNNLYLPDGKTPNPNYGQPTTVPLGSLPRAGAPTTASPPPSPSNPPRLNPSTTSVGALPSALPPGAEIPIKSANEAWAQASQNVNTFSQRMFPVTQSIALLKTGDITTGQGAEAVNNIKSFLQTRLSLLPGINAQSIENADFQKLGKYLQQVVNAQPMAAGSDARLASTLSGNPNAHIDTLANLDVLKAQAGLMRMEQMAAIDFAARGAPNGQWNNFQRSWQTQHDPRAFVVDMLDEKQRDKMIAGMKPSERAAFSRTLDLIEAHPEIMNTAAMPHG